MLHSLRRMRLSRPLLATIVLVGGALAGATGAAGETVSTSAPFAITVTNACVAPAEEVLATGNVHLSIGGNLSGGGTATSQIQANLQGVHGEVVMPLGITKKYVVPESSVEGFMLDVDDAAPFHLTMESMVQFVRQGDDGTYITGDDFYEHILVLVRVNANGTATVEDVKGDTRCQ